jgi:MFS family permease
MDVWLLSLCVARTFSTAIFMSYAAALPVLRPAWAMSATAAGSVSTGWQLGYAVSLVFFSALADHVGARRVFLISAWCSAVAALLFAFFARSHPATRGPE